MIGSLAILIITLAVIGFVVPLMWKAFKRIVGFLFLLAIPIIGAIIYFL